jgi:tyrosyl-tRNA synthetase
MTVRELLQVFPNVPSSSVADASNGWLLVDLLASTGVVASKGEATRLIRGGGLYLNGRRVADEKERVTSAEAIEGQVFVVRKGKKEQYLIRILHD